MVSWTTVRTLLPIFGPILLPRLLAFYRSIRSSSQHAVPKPAPPYVNRSLNILFFSALLFILSTLPYFLPENIYKLTSSRLQTPTDVLFSRLAVVRPINPADEALRSRLLSQDARLLYLQFGPDVIGTCPFCDSDEPSTYLYYALPSILAPHLLHILILGIVTATAFSGREGAKWRTQATIAGVALAAAELYLTATYDYKRNATATGSGDIDFFFWRMRLLRGISIAACDAILGWFLWLSATNRAFLSPPPVAERLEASTKVLEMARMKMTALSNVRNVVLRDKELRGTMASYWVDEHNFSAEAYEQREVVDGVQGALTRVDMGKITEGAGQYADAVFAGLSSNGAP